MINQRPDFIILPNHNIDSQNAMYLARWFLSLPLAERAYIHPDRTFKSIALSVLQLVEDFSHLADVRHVDGNIYNEIEEIRDGAEKIFKSEDVGLESKTSENPNQIKNYVRKIEGGVEEYKYDFINQLDIPKIGEYNYMLWLDEEIDEQDSNDSSTDSDDSQENIEWASFLRDDHEDESSDPAYEEDSLPWDKTFFEVSENKNETNLYVVNFFFLYSFIKH